jgi:hypothetical protein
VCFVLLYSLQDHLRTGMHDLDHPISYRCKKHRQLARLGGGFAACFSSRRSNGSIILNRVAANDEHPTCGGFSLGETIRFGSLEFIADRLSGLSLSPMGDGSDAVAMDSAREGLLPPR